MLASTLALSAFGHTSPASTLKTRHLHDPRQMSELDAPQAPLAALAPSTESYAVDRLLSFNEADVKFSLRDLMRVLRDGRHEGWVLTAYPDPKTLLSSRPRLRYGRLRGWIQTVCRQFWTDSTLGWPPGPRRGSAKESRR